MSNVLGVIGTVLVIAGSALSLSGDTEAARYTSPNYTIDASLDNSFGGDSTGGSYKLTSSGGESIIGNGSGGSYVLDQGYVAQLDSSLQLNVQPKGLELYLPLDETAGDTAYDHSKNQRNGEIDSGIGKTTGQVGGAVEVTSGTVKAVTVSASDLQPNTLTAEAWVNVSSSGSVTGCIVCYDRAAGGASGGPFTLEIDGGNLRWFVRSSPSNALTSPIGKDSWQHVVGTYNHLTGEQKLYINGSQVNQATVTASAINYGPYSDTDNIVLFYEEETAAQLLGTIDEVKLYSRDLSSNEIEAAYQAGLDGHAAGVAFAEDIISGDSQTTEAEAIVWTDAPGYSLSLSQSGDLSDGTETIDGLTSTVASPTAWNEGTTTGFGFTVASATATPPDAKWNSGSSYAGLPSSATSFYSRTGFSGGAKDEVLIRYRIDVEADQPTGSYKNTVTYTGVMLP